MTKLLKKKWISYLTLAVMMISLLACFTFSGSAVVEVDGKTHYYIASVEHWEALATKMTIDSNTVVHLTSNLNFEDTAPSQVTNTFAGTFEGNGYTITSNVQSAALFKTVSGTVKDLNVAGTVTGSSIGVIAQTLSNGGTIRNSGVRSTVTGSSVYAIASSNSGTITGCYFSGTGASGLAPSGTITYSVFGSTAYTTSSSSCASIYEAAWKVNCTGNAYFTIGYATANDDSLFKVGTSRDQIVKTTIDGTVTYNEPGDEITLSTVDGKTAVVTKGCAYIKSNVLYLTGVSDNANEVVVEYQDAEVAAKAQGKAELETLIAVYEDPNFNSEYFTEAGWAKMQTWLSEAKAMIAADTATGAQYHSKFVNGRSVEVISDLGYVPARYYSLYQYFPSFTDMSISTKEDWLAMVEASNMETVEVTQYYNGNFAGLNKQFHLINDVDMENTPMLPLCYGHDFAGNINGHGYTLKNINIDVESPYGSVGLVGIQSGTSVIQNLQVTGSITVSGRPIFNSTQVSTDHRHEGNRVGGIAGQSSKNSVIRKCLVDVDFSVKNAGNVGGVLGDTRSAAYVDGCIVLGETGGVGIVGEGANVCKVYNSIYGGQSGIIKYHKNVMGNVDGDLNNCISNCYSLLSPIVWRGNWTKTDETTGDVIDLWTTEVDNYAKTFAQAYMVETLLEAAYQANQGYYDSGLGDGERIYFTVDADGNPTFGDENNQIIKLDVQDQSGATINTYYAPSTGTLALNHERSRNYYAISGDEGESYLKGQTLYTKNAPDGMVLKTDTYVDSGNVYGATGTVNLADAQMVLRAAVGLSEVDIPAGDVNFNDKLDVNDAVLIIRQWMGDKSGYNTADHAQTNMDGWYTVASYNLKNLDWEGPSPVLMDGLETGNTYHSYATTGTTDHSLMPLADECAAVINSVGDIDLLGIQEIGQITGTDGALHSYCSDCYSQLDTLNSKIGGNMNSSFNWASRSSGGYHYVDYGAAIMTPHTISSTSRVEYSSQYGVVYESKQERRTYSKNVVTMTDGSGVQFVWYNTHPGNMVEEMFAELMADAQAEYAAGKYVVITADFNYWPQGMSQYLQGNFTMANGGTDGNVIETTTAVTGTAIDNIVISNNLEFYYEPGTSSAMHVVSFDDLTATQKTGCDQTWASDHNLVYAYVRVKK